MQRLVMVDYEVRPDATLITNDDSHSARVISAIEDANVNGWDVLSVDEVPMQGTRLLLKQL